MATLVRKSPTNGTQLALKPTLLEGNFPFRELSLVIGADQRARDPIYGIHRWWARRPPALIRGLLIANHLDAETSLETFWQMFGSSERPLAGQRVLDPFAGGGSTLVEAARLGAHVMGSDVDPLAMSIVRAELSPPNPQDFRKAADELLESLTSSFGELYPMQGTATPLHYFYVPIVICPHCEFSGPLYRNLVLAQDSQRPGAVVRDNPLTCYCPTCFSLKFPRNPDAAYLRCCGRHHPLWSGNFSHQFWSCPHCGTKSSHRDLQTGASKYRLLAIEEVPSAGRRRLRPPTPQDLGALHLSHLTLSTRREVLPLPRGEIQVGRQDARPLSYGLTRYEDLFTSRQLLVLGSAWLWLAKCDWSSSIQLALEMALSNALATNNRLCGYATDYGRLSPLFTVRGYSLPALPVELNPLHLTSGRGTIAACLSRIERAASSKNIRRYTWNTRGKTTAPVRLDLTTSGVSSTLACHSADTVPNEKAISKADLCIFDPPYYDYIAYDELSAFYRAWRDNSPLNGKPLLPEVPSGESFGCYLARCIAKTLIRVKSIRPIAFTYHSTNPAAWEAVGNALDTSGLRVTALWPIRCDGHMGPHSHDGNIEWDLVIVARPKEQTNPHTPQLDVAEWIHQVKPLRVSRADRSNFALALAMATPRFASLRKHNA